MTLDLATAAKKLARGGFLLPVPAEGQKCVVLDASKVASLFRA